MESKNAKGVFVDIMGFYWFNDCQLTLKKLNKKFPDYAGEIKELIDSFIIKIGNDDNIHIAFLDEQRVELVKARKRRQRAGKAGGSAPRNNA